MVLIPPKRGPAPQALYEVCCFEPPLAIKDQIRVLGFLDLGEAFTLHRGFDIRLGNLGQD